MEKVSVNRQLIMDNSWKYRQTTEGWKMDGRTKYDLKTFCLHHGFLNGGGNIYTKTSGLLI